MTKFRNRTFAACCALAVAFAGLCSVVAVAQGASSVREQELKAALSVSQKQIAELREQLNRAEIQRKDLVNALAGAVKNSEQQVAASRDMQLKLQAFGVDLFTMEEGSLEQRLLKAVRDLDISQQELERRTKRLHEISESYLKYVQATPEASEGDRKAAMASIDKAGKALKDIADSEPAADVSDSQIVSVDQEIGLVVFDAGREAGVRVGTPIAVLRGERPIFSAMIVDVRDAISGAVLQDRLADVENVSVGDGIQLLPNQPNL